ncbi:MAG TPA: hypothetical protein VL240_09500 [Candidatus Binatia bacterium]|nr:hypothetical protein [Candidatus Binatia bacterium]
MRNFARAAVYLNLLLAATLLVAQHSSLAGDYQCKSVRGAACSTNHNLRLLDDGTWSYDFYRGTYSVQGNRVTFGPNTAYLHSWGSAQIGPGSLTFNEFGDDAIWVKPSSASGRLAMGNYYCETAPRGCMTRNPIQILSDHDFTWGPIRANYSILDGQLRFGGLSEGPAGWGLAAIGNGTINFRAADGSISVWRLTSGNPYAGQPCNPHLPMYEQKGCTPQ